MFNLIKYELRKTMNIKGIFLVLLALSEIVYLIGLYGDNDETLAMGMMILMLVAFAGIITIGIHSIKLLSNDLNTKQSYMLFMTPNSSYKILGAKMIENTLSLLIAGAVIIVIAMVDLTALVTKYGELTDVVSFFNMFLDDTMQINAPAAITSFLAALVNWIYIVTVAFFAVVISATFLNGRKFNGLISFLIFIVVNTVVGHVVNAIVDEGLNITPEYNLTLIVIYLILSGVMYAITAWIMDHWLSV
ncbi:MAG: hypothetical protein K6F66_00390 [Pseudobutyrivibrio sp.]|nr:hypothetical protein [Pseudobutyrivibrio sp.]